MSVTRDQIQKQINNILNLYPEADLEQIKENLGPWLDVQELAFDGLDKDFIKSRILDDVNSYKGVE